VVEAVAALFAVAAVVVLGESKEWLVVGLGCNKLAQIREKEKKG
jgi:hypothetical protein